MGKKFKRHRKQNKQDTPYNTGNHEKGVGISRKRTEEGAIPSENDKKAINIDPGENINMTYEVNNKGIEKDTIKDEQSERVETCKKDDIIEKTEQCPKLDLTTKILIAIFAILLLIITFAKKLGIQGFP